MDCLLYFTKAKSRDIGANDYHGDDGLTSVTTPKNGKYILYQAFIATSVQAGYRRTEDLNGYAQEGFGSVDRTTTPNGRCSCTARGL